MAAFGLDINSGAVCVYGPDTTKHEALDALIDAVSNGDVVTDAEAFRQAVYEREKVMSTGIGQGVAIPHVRIDEVLRPTMAVGISDEGIDFDTLDNEPVNIVVLFAMPTGSQKEYLSLLAQVMTAMKTPGFREGLLECDSADDVAIYLNQA